MARYVRVVSIWIHVGQEAAFEAFEHAAARRMAAYGGRVDAAVRTAPGGEVPGPEAATPYELHVVSFPDRTAFDSYAADPETRALQERRAAIIALTMTTLGQEAGPYGVESP
jgi:hypothetical protein